MRAHRPSGSACLDFAVLGRFVAAKPSQFPLRTSANQVLRLFSDRYREEHFKPLEFEVHIEAQGLVQITGFRRRLGRQN
jgi:hypothetical protein